MSAICTGKDVGDLGHGVRAELRYVNGELVGMDWRHTCGWEDGVRRERYDHLPLKPYWHVGWDVVSTDQLSLSPSILCTFCKFHGFIRDGKWVPA